MGESCNNCATLEARLADFTQKYEEWKKAAHEENAKYLDAHEQNRKWKAQHDAHVCKAPAATSSVMDTSGSCGNCATLATKLNEVMGKNHEFKVVFDKQTAKIQEVMRMNHAYEVASKQHVCKPDVSSAMETDGSCSNCATLASNLAECQSLYSDKCTDVRDAQQKINELHDHINEDLRVEIEDLIADKEGALERVDEVIEEGKQKVVDLQTKIAEVTSDKDYWQRQFEESDKAREDHLKHCNGGRKVAQPRGRFKLPPQTSGAGQTETGGGTGQNGTGAGPNGRTTVEPCGDLDSDEEAFIADLEED